MSIEFEIKCLVEYYAELEKERDDALEEAEIMRELLFEIRYICFSEYAVNDQILKLIKTTVKKQLKYDHEDWSEQFGYREDDDGNPIKFYMANKYRAKIMKKDTQRSRKGEKYD
tara:strand:+ start:2411 stop:2752 length:342 start_codon:yes stop_codon:yes gene_type:complete